MKALPIAAKICILLALLAFFLPFINVSCSSQGYGVDINVTYTGFDMMFGIKSGNESAGEYEEGAGASVSLIFAFIAGIAAIALSFVQKKRILQFVAAGLSLFGTLMFIIFRATFKSKYLGDTDILSAVTVKSKVGWVFALILFIAAAALLVIAALADKKVQYGGYPQGGQADTKNCPWCGQIIPSALKFCPYCTQPLKRQCPYCGAENNIETRFCVACGQAVQTPGGDSAPQG